MHDKKKKDHIDLSTTYIKYAPSNHLKIRCEFNNLQLKLITANYINYILKKRKEFIDPFPQLQNKTYKFCQNPYKFSLFHL
jgi:hypothetical protein